MAEEWFQRERRFGEPWVVIIIKGLFHEHSLIIYLIDLERCDDVPIPIDLFGEEENWTDLFIEDHLFLHWNFLSLLNSMFMMVRQQCRKSVGFLSFFLGFFFIINKCSSCTLAFNRSCFDILPQWFLWSLWKPFYWIRNLLTTNVCMYVNKWREICFRNESWQSQSIATMNNSWMRWNSTNTRRTEVVG